MTPIWGNNLFPIKYEALAHEEEDEKESEESPVTKDKRGAVIL